LCSQIKPMMRDFFTEQVPGFIIPIPAFSGRAKAVLVKPGSILACAP